MAAREEETGLGAARVLDADEVQGVLSGSVLHARAARSRARASRKAEPKPDALQGDLHLALHGDLERLDGLVDELKARGITKANRSALIRVALDQVDLDKVPRGL